MFDIVAANIQELTPGRASAAPKHALYIFACSAMHSSADLTEVLGLPERKQKEFAAPLQETTLLAIITAAIPACAGDTPVTV